MDPSRPSSLQSILAQRWLFAALVVLAGALLSQDVYSFGYIGGDWNAHFGRNMEIVPNHPWQRVATAMLVVLLCAGLAALLASRWTAARGILAAEAMLFVVLNIIYLVRDGGLRYTGHGMSHAPTGLRIVAAGLLIRAVILAGLSLRKPTGRETAAD